MPFAMPRQDEKVILQRARSLGCGVDPVARPSYWVNPFTSGVFIYSWPETYMNILITDRYFYKYITEIVVARVGLNIPSSDTWQIVLKM